MNAKISVVLASYNGEKHIKEQVSSILMCLSKDDELIVSDDGSTDKTLDIVKSFGDLRIKVVDGPKQGFVRNFENAIRYTTGEYIFFSDQDDIWENNKIEKILKVFESNPTVGCIRHNAVVVDNDMNVLDGSYNNTRGANTKAIKNIFKNTFTGCCMAVRKSWLMLLLPTPNKLFHDAWIGILSCRFNKALVIEDTLIKWRRHDNNVTNIKKRNSLWHIFLDRIRLIYCYIKKVHTLKKINKANRRNG